MKRSLLAATVLAAAALPVAACTNAPGTSATTTTAAPTTGTASSPDRVAWMDNVCTEITRVVDSQASPPNMQDVGSVEGGLKAFDAYMAQNIAAIDQTVAGLKNVGPSPIEGGDQAVSTMTSGLESLRNGYQTTKDKFATVNPNDPQAGQTVVEALTALGQGAEQLGTAMQTVEKNPGMEEAARQAPACQKLENAVSTVTPTS